MSDRLPDNLSRLYDLFGEDTVNELGTGESFIEQGVEFVCRYQPGSTPERFYLVKPRAFAEWYRGICDRVRGGRIFELGIAEGGSVALFTLLADPSLLIAIDNETSSVDALDAFIDQRGLHDRVRPHYGVDQGDGDRLREILDEDLGDASLDLVVDDASHVYELTRSSFGTLFPRLAPGGLYVIEDWNQGARFRDAIARAMREGAAGGRPAGAAPSPVPRLPDAIQPHKNPLHRLALELTLACASADDAVREVSCNEQVVVVVRGAAELDPTSFSLDDAYRDHFDQLTPVVE